MVIANQLNPMWKIKKTNSNEKLVELFTWKNALMLLIRRFHEEHLLLIAIWLKIEFLPDTFPHTHTQTLFKFIQF